MLAVFACAALLCVASLVAGRAVLVLLGRREWTWLAAPVGLAALIVIAQPLVRLPGRGLTAAVAIAVLLAAALLFLSRRPPPRERPGALVREGLPPALFVLAAAAIPFLVSGRVAVLGEGVYTNDHAAQLFWAEWLATGAGPEPRGIEFGYPLGAQSLAAVLARGTGASLQTAFNGLLFAVPALTALASLTILRPLPPLRRAIAASLVGLPYLAAAFLAQSAFKETVMALLLVGFALALAELTPQPAARPAAPGAGSPRAAAAALVAFGVMTLAAVLTFSLAALVWPLSAAALWLALAAALGTIDVSPRRAAAALRPLWPALAAGAVALAAIAAAQAGPLAGFVERFGDIQESTGRLFSPVSPREALGVWPNGDFRADVAGDPEALVATAIGIAAMAFAAWWWLRRRELAVPTVLAAGLLVYAAARWRGGIHVEAKALAVLSPVAMLFAVRALLGPRPVSSRFGREVVAGLATLFVLGAAGSTFLALREAPVGGDARPAQLAELREEVQGEPVLVLVGDRFAPYRLRGARTASPGGYVPSDQLAGRPGKRWDQGRALDFDSVSHRVLNRYPYVITSTAGYGSSAPPEYELVGSTPSYALWRRERPVRAQRVIEPPEAPGAVLDCERRRGSELAEMEGTATVLPEPVLGPRREWRPSATVRTGESVSQTVELKRGRWEVSLQYHSPMGLVLEAPGLREQLPASLEGMYRFAPGEGQWWPAGRVEVEQRGPVRFSVRSAELPWAGRVLGAERSAWLGNLALTQPGEPREVSLADACGRYVDRYTPTRR